MYKYLFESLLSISGIAGKYVNSVFNLLGAVAVFFKALQYFTFPTAVHKGSDFPTSLEKEMTNHSSTLAWKIPWTEELDRLQSMGSQRVGHDWATSLSLSIND